MHFLGATFSFSRNDPTLTSREVQFTRAKAAAFFMRPKLSKVVRELEPQVVELFNDSMRGIKLLPHASYTINLCAEDKARLKESIRVLECDMRLGAQLKTAPVFHPGSNKNKKRTQRQLTYQIAQAIDEVLARNKDGALIIETMSSANGTLLCSNFDEMGEVLSLVRARDRVGVCIDTCHMFVSGIDIREKSQWRDAMREFDAKVGFKYLRGVHMNDSKNELGSGHDVHAPIGKGRIGFTPFIEILKDARFSEIPLVTETHLHLEGIKGELERLNAMAK